MLPQYVGGATVFGVVTNLLTDTDERALRHPAVKRMVLDTVQWGEETGRELFAKAVSCVNAPGDCLRLTSNVPVDTATHVAHVDAPPPRDTCSSSVLDRIFTSPFDDPPLPPTPLPPTAVIARDDVSVVSLLERAFTCTAGDEPAPEPIVALRDDVCTFAPAGLYGGTQVLGLPACNVGGSFYNGSTPYVGLKTINNSGSLSAFGAGSGFGFTVIALVIGVLLARFLFPSKHNVSRPLSFVLYRHMAYAV